MRVRRDHDRQRLGFARDLRKNSTDAERKLWAILRNSQLGGFKFRRQYPVAGFILDFYCTQAKLCIELDGGQHNDAPGMAHDKSRTEELEQHGIRIIRFWNDDVLKNTDAVAEEILHVLFESHAPYSSPGTPGEAG